MLLFRCINDKIEGVDRRFNIKVLVLLIIIIFILKNINMLRVYFEIRNWFDLKYVFFNL